MAYSKVMNLPKVGDNVTAYCKLANKPVIQENGKLLVIVLCFASRAERDKGLENCSYRDPIYIDPDFTDCLTTREIRTHQPPILISSIINEDGSVSETWEEVPDVVTTESYWNILKACYQGIKKVPGYENTNEI